jgi:hypothetical protein
MATLLYPSTLPWPVASRRCLSDVQRTQPLETI